MSTRTHLVLLLTDPIPLQHRWSEHLRSICGSTGIQYDRFAIFDEFILTDINFARSRWTYIDSSISGSLIFVIICGTSVLQSVVNDQIALTIPSMKADIFLKQ